MRLSREKKNVGVLGLCQVLFNTGRGLTFLASGLVSEGVFDAGVLVTIPLTMMLIGTAAGTLPSALLMRRIGRKAGFVVGSVIGTGGALLAALAIIEVQFVLFNASIFLFGLYSGFAQQYRFAAADVASADFKATAIALVLAAGVMGAFTGPYSAIIGKDWIDGSAFAGSFLILAGCALLSGLVVLGIDIPKLTKAEFDDPGRPLLEIFKAPVVIVAVIAATFSYVVMNLLMTVTPISMQYGYSFGDGDVALVISWHVVGMFAPGFVTGSLIKRFGTLQIITVGLALLTGAVAVALLGVEFWHFWVSLFLLGCGWNFAFTGGTALLTEIDTPSERAKLQGTNDFIVFTAVAFASLVSGAVYQLLGWNWVNILAVPMIVIAMAAVTWLALTRRRERIAAPAE